MVVQQCRTQVVKNKAQCIVTVLEKEECLFSHHGIDFFITLSCFREFDTVVGRNTFSVARAASDAIS